MGGSEFQVRCPIALCAAMSGVVVGHRAPAEHRRGLRGTHVGDADKSLPVTAEKPVYDDRWLRVMQTCRLFRYAEFSGLTEKLPPHQPAIGYGTQTFPSSPS